VTPVEWVAVELARRLGHVEAAVLLRRPPFRDPVEAALAIMPAEDVVAAVVVQGPLATARSPYGVLIHRLRCIEQDAEERARLADEVTEAGRWRRVDAAVRRGESLRALVESQRLYLDEAESTIARQFAADDDRREFARAALNGGRR
jgi:hypothetical protein